MGTCDVYKTIIYGGDTINNVQQETDGGKITGIISWGIENNADWEWQYHALTNLSWSNDKGIIIENNVGSDPMKKPCNPFILNYDDYINGYRVIYGRCKTCIVPGTFVNGLIFHTKNGASCNCTADETYLADNYTDTGNNYYNDSYLSGFYIKSGGVINGIGFQFTKMCNNTLISSSTTAISDNKCEVIQTEEYGGSTSGDGIYIATDLGKITGINSWGIDNNSDPYHYHAIAKFNWINSKNIINVHEIGSDSVTPCDPFTLIDDDYINGYRVLYGPCKQCEYPTAIFVNGLVFHTKNGASYECIGDQSDLADSTIDSGDVYYNNSYLSGFHLKSGGVIDSIKFEFTPLCQEAVSGLTDLEWGLIIAGICLVILACIGVIIYYMKRSHRDDDNVENRRVM